MKKNVIAAAAACVLLGAVLMSGCGAEETPETTPEASTTETTLAEAGQDICTVETPCGELHFQARWSDYMQIRQEQEGDTHRVFFMARLNEKDYPLFDLAIGPAADETDTMVLTDEQGIRHRVDVNMEESMEYAELDSNGQEILYSMQEQINFIIENMK